MTRLPCIRCVRLATRDDADGACVAVRRSITEICGPDYGHEEKVMSDWLANKTPDILRTWIESPDSYCVVAVLPSSEIVGFGQVNRSGCVELCYVAPAGLHQGYGRAMLQAMERQGVQWGLETLHLHSSLTAKSFYERNGYRLKGEAKMFGSTLGDFPMAKKLVP
jgi:putative acetyltransferase